MQEDRIGKMLQTLMDSHQEAPRLGNQFLEDTALREYIGLYLSLLHLDADSKVRVLEQLAELGARVPAYQELAEDAERHPPELQLFDAYGKRVNRVHTSEGWKKMRAAALREDIIPGVYSGAFGPAGRFVQMIKLYLFQASGAMWGAPLAATDGSAHVLKAALGQGHPHESELRRCFERLVARDPAQSWTSGQWTVEKEGHLEPVKRVQTIAVSTADPHVYRLFGVKWYTAAPEGDLSIVAARILDAASGEPAARLSAFLVRLKDERGELRTGLEIIRLKEKLGMKAVPAAEVVLRGVEGVLLSAPGDGLKLLYPMVRITRMYNSAAAVAFARRVHVLCKDYSLR